MRRAILDIASDVREGLSRPAKSLPPRLFYDAEGSALFEEITRLPEYYLTRAEQALFDRHAEEILARAGEALTLVELGAGSGEKTRTLMRAVLRRQPRATYMPVDVSAAALQMASSGLQREFPSLAIIPLEGRYRVALPALRSHPGRKLVLFIGSSIGNFDPPDAIALLRDVRGALSPGDALLLGTDLRKDPAVLVPAYDDAQGVTARFNLNVLALINRELGANFLLDQFRHVACWNASASRMEMHLESLREQTVSIRALRMEVHFGAGERIHTENSYKFTQESVDRMLDEAAFEREETWSDPQGLFTEHLARAR